jgi:hypothetical protein
VRGGGSPEGDQPPRRKHPLVEKKEDTVGRETMINAAMSSTLMGNLLIRTWVVIDLEM